MDSEPDLANRLVHLDLLRGLAAIVVLIEHARAFIFVSYASLNSPSIGLTAFYATTSFGHQAVVAFFVLSGFLVGGQAWIAMQQKRFSWRRYVLRRVTRLWIVVIPGLALTFALDRIGLLLSGSTSGYVGKFSETYPSLPANGTAVDLSFPTLMGNLFFLQTIATPVLGSNGPLWSLAWEFWYYMIFPFLAMVVQGGSALERAISGMAAALMILLLPFDVMKAGLIWLAGVSAAALARSHFASMSPIRHPLVISAAILAPLAVLALTLKPTTDPGDIVLGLVIATGLIVFTRAPLPGHWYTKFARAISEISFTLYDTHFPILMLITMVCFAPERGAPSLETFVRFGVLIGVAVFIAGLFWLLFERHTDRLFSWVSGRLSPGATFPRHRSTTTL